MMLSVSFCSVLSLCLLGITHSQYIPTEFLWNRNNDNFTRYKRQLDDYKCTLPEYPDNGQWTVISGYARPGDEVDINTMLKFECSPGYMLTPNIPYVVCDRNWNPDNIPKCGRLCSPFYSTPTTSLKCKDRSGNRIGCDKATDGTYLTYECIPYYEVPLGRKQSLFCLDGTWDFPKPVCQPGFYGLDNDKIV